MAFFDLFWARIGEEMGKIGVFGAFFLAEIC
jgi:hypothetical protein